MKGRRGHAALLIALALLVACSGGDTEPVSQAAPEERSEPAEPAVCPLTGEKPPESVDLERAAVAVKVENSRESRPQSGLEDADLVYEEIVEGGITRFMAFYHCGDSDRAGPVRSARFDDPKIARPITRVLGFSGANGIVERELDRQKMVALNELNTSNTAFFRVPPGNLDIHSLFVDVSKLRAAAPKPKLDAPREPFRFGALPPGAKRARSAVVHFNASNEITYRYRGGSWKRWEAGQPFMTKAGRQISVPNVLIQQVEVNNSKTIFDPAGNPSPDIALEGRGPAWLLRDGRVVAGRWRIGEPGDLPVFTTKSGDPFTFAVGPTWVELVPSRKGDVKGSVAIK
jgi:Protein of unknown function (DUF3048) N-terminal domain/Protein of unknown function (DUF3048) C-terminal domain